MPQSFFLVEVSPSNNNCAAFVGRFNDYIFAFFFTLFSADHSSKERLENLVNAGKGFFNVLLNLRFVDFLLEMGTKFKPLLRNDFSESESSSKFSGMVTTVLRFSGDESLVI